MFVEAYLFTFSSHVCRQGYECSKAGSEVTASIATSFSHLSFIFYNREVFSEISFHHLSVQTMARKVGNLPIHFSSIHANNSNKKRTELLQH